MHETAPHPKDAKSVVPRPVDYTEVLRQFRSIINAVKVHYTKVESKRRISGVQLWALSFIQDRGGLSVKELAQALGVKHSTKSCSV